MFQNLSTGSFTHSVLNLLFPPLCCHCQETLEDPSNVLCFHCLSSMELINPEERCSYCFASLCEGESQICSHCRTRYPAYHRVASAFDYLGPPATLIKQMKYQDKPWLAEGIASFLYYQYLRMDWPMPDVVIPMPICWAHWIERGYNQSSLITNELATLLDKPFQDCMKRRSGDFSQAGKSRKQRRELSQNCFEVKRGVNLKDKIILLVDDVMTTGTTIEICSEVLMEQFPKKIYVLTFCRAVD